MSQIRHARAELVLDARAIHGEGPAWDAASARLLWVDLLGARLHQTGPDGSDATVQFDRPVCAVVPRAGGGLALALGDGFWLQGPDGDLRRVYAFAQPGPPLGPVRMNDGKCDPAGRFWAGSMAYDGRAGAGSLYRLDPDWRVAEILRDVTVSNGLAWRPDGTTMYYIDSALQRVDVFDADPATGDIRNRRPAVAVPAASGTPDGMTIDDDGCLWVALWGGSSVHRYTPDGRLDTIVEVPCANATSCAFGGNDLRDLYITTSPLGLSEADRAAQPLAGAVFRFRPGVSGPAAVAFAG
ncbi:MAG: SMP-30/gluconolactonase/LRE family protein [Candidatus Limnocylindrales bacterium]